MNLEELESKIIQKADDLEKKTYDDMKVTLSLSDIVNFDALNEEFDIQNKLVCATCKNLPIAPIKICKKTDVLYCHKCLIGM